MRHTRWLLLAALITVVAAVGYIYFGRLASMAKDNPAPVRPLPTGVEATAQEWHYSTKTGNCPQLEVRSKSFRQVKEPATFELEGVNLQLFHDCGKEFDRVESAKAQFDTTTGIMFSEGEVQITMGIPAGKEPTEHQIKVTSSGVRFETKTGTASTDRPAEFLFEGGTGKSVGAEYDPNKHELQLKNAVEINLKAKGPTGKATKIETAYLVYLEKESKVVMQPWSRLTREGLVLNTAMSVAEIENKHLKRLEAVNAWGSIDEDGRKVEYQAEAVQAWLTPEGQVTTMTAERKAHLVSTSDTARTDIQSDKIDMEFATTDKDSVLSRALATGHSVVDSNPVVKPGAPQGETKVLKSDVVEMWMRPGGREMERAETAGPGTIEFIPNRPAMPHRTLTGDKLWIAYGAANQVENFRSINVKTRTDNPAKNGKPQPPTITTSKEFRADFDPKTHQMSRLEQTTNFRYEEGERKAQSDKATLEQATNMMTLTGSARVTDTGGSASADQIVMNQKTGDFDADGHVSSTRLPDKKGQPSSAMLNNDEPLQAKANKMTARENNMVIHYEGNAVAWQGANRIQADRLDIDRDDEVLKASGQVVSQFVDKAKKDKNGKSVAGQTTGFTVVRAPEMTYTEEERTAVYKGGVVLNRPNLNVRSRELTAYLKDKDADSSLDKAFAEGAVTIVQTAPGRLRTGTSDHAEYYADEEKIILEKGQPKFVDSLEGTTEGTKLTYYMNDDRLLVNGVESKRSKTVIRRKK